MRASFNAIRTGPTPRPVVARTSSIPSPVGGWDAVSPIAQMDPKRAVHLVNWFPQPDWVELRKGTNRHANTRTGAPVETLMSYQGVSSVRMFAVADGEIHDVTAGGNTSPVVTGLTNSRFQYVNFSTTGGHFLYAVNGADVPQVFDGTSWSTASITGIDPTSIVGVNAHKSRLFFTLNNSTQFAYLPVDSYQGAAETYELGGLFTLGGYLMAMGTWTLDAGNGPDDYAAFMSSRGQVAIFTGGNPGDAADWSLKGVFTIGPPIGRRCFFKVASDLAIISIDGVVPLSKSLIFERAAITRISLTANIQRVMNQSARNYKDNFGWQLISYPRGTRAILNVPIIEGQQQEQYVMNTLSGAWCRFTGMNANCWETMNDRIFFGANNGLVMEADVGGSDYNAVLSADMFGAFNYFGMQGRQKRFMMCRPLLTTDKAVRPGLALNVDFKTDAPISVPDTTGIQDAVWDEALWDQGIWGGAPQASTEWTSVAGIGYWGSIRMQVDVKPPFIGGVWNNGLWGVAKWGAGVGSEITLQVNGFSVVMEPGGVI